MKNIYILPTNKPTGIFKSGNNLLFSIINKVRTNNEGFHIYITSDEKAKEGDWGYIPFQGGDVKPAGKYFADDWIKVILTTDPDLIADGVQPIEDEFLNWFSKNPDCEFVPIITTIVSNKCNYKTNIGFESWKEELKQSVEEYEQQGLEKYFEESKQESNNYENTILTILEDSEKESSDIISIDRDWFEPGDILYDGDQKIVITEIIKLDKRISKYRISNHMKFKAGYRLTLKPDKPETLTYTQAAKKEERIFNANMRIKQAQKMYSEEDMRKAIIAGLHFIATDPENYETDAYEILQSIKLKQSKHE
jgi:hypothetical protein